MKRAEWRLRSGRLPNGLQAEKVRVSRHQWVCLSTDADCDIGRCAKRLSGTIGLLQQCDCRVEGEKLTWLSDDVTVVADNLALCLTLCIKWIGLHPQQKIKLAIDVWLKSSLTAADTPQVYSRPDLNTQPMPNQILGHQWAPKPIIPHTGEWASVA